VVIRPGQFLKTAKMELMENSLEREVKPSAASKRARDSGKCTPLSPLPTNRAALEAKIRYLPEEPLAQPHLAAPRMSSSTESQS